MWAERIAMIGDGSNAGPASFFAGPDFVAGD
jgi:hypothetical protein